MAKNTKKFNNQKYKCANIHDIYASALNLSNSLSSDHPNPGEEEPGGPEEDEECSNSKEKIRLYLWHFNQCDSKRCTGKRLIRSGLAKTLPMNQRFTGIVLSPLAKTMFSLEDVNLVRDRGIAVIDCSWNKIDQTPIPSIQAKNTRLLPFLVAANPTHFGRPYQLSCVEALASALYISNFKSQAAFLLSQFNWGETFIEVNSDAFELYSSLGHTSEDVTRLQEEYLESEKSKLNERKFVNYVDYQDISESVSQ